MIRVAGLDPNLIKKALDSGASAGFALPKSAQALRLVESAAK